VHITDVCVAVLDNVAPDADGTDGEFRLNGTEVEAGLDFGTLRFLDTESFTSFPEGSSREADIVAELHTRDGAPELLLVHVEVQARWGRDFAKRMFQYYPVVGEVTRSPFSPSRRICDEAAPL
jgi:hypothetical protein